MMRRITKRLANRMAAAVLSLAMGSALEAQGDPRMTAQKQAQDGMARALVPSHTPLDGDLVFSAATGARAMADPLRDSYQIGHAAATCLARAIARAVYEARPAPGDRQPAWASAYGSDQ